MKVKPIVVFVDNLPEKRPRKEGSGRPSKYDSKLELLKKRPNQWARINRFGNANGAWSTIRRLRKNGRWSNENVELVARHHGKDGSEIYARYLTEDPIPFMEDSEVSHENDNTEAS